jgi:hypothetical protein
MLASKRVVVRIVVDQAALNDDGAKASVVVLD